MKLIVESDLGHDPDDFFAICYLHAAGVDIKTILISPGDPDQIAIAKLLCKELGLDIPIGASKLDREKNSSGSIHHDLLNKYNYPMQQKADGLGVDILKDIVKNDPDCELFIMGPVSSLGEFLIRNPNIEFSRATMQGGYLPYHLHTPMNPEPKFFGKASMPTFNMNGDREGAVAFLNAKIKQRQIVGKNICHTVLFNQDRVNEIRNTSTRGARLFEEAAIMYFQKHDFKKFHDPTAACCHLHPEIGTWFKGKTIKDKGNWTTVPDESGDDILADIDYDMLWTNILSFK